MFITDLVSITELSLLTKKSRPSIYKYIACYKNGALDQIPYTFIKLLDMANEPGVTKEQIRLYCLDTYGDAVSFKNAEFKGLIKLLYI